MMKLGIFFLVVLSISAISLIEGAAENSLNLERGKDRPNKKRGNQDLESPSLLNPNEYRNTQPKSNRVEDLENHFNGLSLTGTNGEKLKKKKSSLLPQKKDLSDRSNNPHRMDTTEDEKNTGHVQFSSSAPAATAAHFEETEFARHRPAHHSPQSPNILNVLASAAAGGAVEDAAALSMPGSSHFHSPDSPPSRNIASAAAAAAASGFLNMNEANTIEYTEEDLQTPPRRPVNIEPPNIKNRLMLNARLRRPPAPMISPVPGTINEAPMSPLLL